ncbi:MAG: hypothetical protein ABR559_01920 [Gemmatimonadota bacterium]
MTAGDGALDSSDELPLLSQILTHPETLAPDVLLWAGGELRPGAGPGRMVLGWRRGGGPVVVACTTGQATEALLVQALQRAASCAKWPVSRWDELLEESWAVADGLLAAVGDRWGLGSQDLRRAAAWTEAAWGAPPAPGQPAVGLLAARVSNGLRRAVDWLTTADREIAAFELERAAAGAPLAYGTHQVAGGWRGAPERPLPARATAPLEVTPVAAAPTALQAALERLCRAAGGTVVWRREWVRFDGRLRSLRLFPGPGGIELQFMGANEGVLVGLRYRFGVPLATRPPPAAAPGGHLWLAEREDLTPAVEKLLAFWLGELKPGLAGEPLRAP